MARIRMPQDVREASSTPCEEDGCRPLDAIDLKGRKALVVGVANEHSLAWAAARWLRAAGAEIAMTYLNEKARPFVAPLAERVESKLVVPCDVTKPGQLEAAFSAVEANWGHLDVLIHSIAWAPKDDLRGRLTDSSADGFLAAMSVSCHSFVRMARLAERLMRDGGSLLTMSYLGAEKVVDHYNLMGPVKAALESSVRYLAHELGPKNIRVNAISAGPIKTRAASGLEHFDELLGEAARRAPLRRLVSSDEVGRAALMLTAPLAAGITGEIVHVDAGFHAAGMVFH